VHAADAAVVQQLDIERAGRRAVVRTGGVPDLGVRVHLRSWHAVRATLAEFAAGAKDA
jgi:hypothetical protein